MELREGKGHVLDPVEAWPIRPHSRGTMRRHRSNVRPCGGMAHKGSQSRNSAEASVMRSTLWRHGPQSHTVAELCGGMGRTTNPAETRVARPTLWRHGPQSHTPMILHRGKGHTSGPMEAWPTRLHGRGNPQRQRSRTRPCGSITNRTTLNTTLARKTWAITEAFDPTGRTGPSPNGDP